jgi:hypothetical protein
MNIYNRLILLIFASITASQNTPYTIQSLPAYSLQRACVQGCLAGEYAVAYDLNCPQLNACVCRTDLQSQVSTYLTSCVNAGCSTNPPDLSSAVELYDSYCSMNGYPIVGAVVTTTASTSFVTSPATATVIIVPTATVTATETSSLTSVATISSVESQSSSTSTSSSTTTTSISSTTIPISTSASTPAVSTKAGPGTGAIAGGVVGGIAVIGIIVALIFFFLRRRPNQTPVPFQETVHYDEQLQPNLYNAPNTASPSPPYVQNTAPYMDVKNGHEVYEAAAAGPSSPAEHTYGASREIWKA